MSATPRKRTVTQEKALLEMAREMEKTRKFLALMKVKEGIIPTDWVTISDDMAEDHKKIDIDLSLDEDVVKWFRRTGDGHVEHINRVLRLFMLNVIAKEQEGYYDRALLDGKPL